ncbi:uncharacterized protein N7459_004604 [Penicillium hispanicum]|uniref:uncharacterized protein n=1 Tax=Penicillium hispanicum TaxID=1080232 RepID=UPI002541AD5E|nr:uncharacterized protein N7459_004604 [Penicillium hispanicum]KAJ5584804.1 hypothetical protein N7459_004604 [Penicillium hispanicum]
MALPYTIAPHLEYFNVPLAKFAAARPEFDSFGVGGYIFSQDADLASEADAPTPPRILLLQRALTDSMGGCWEGPGGASEPGVDVTLLDGVAREVLEESGLHVSRMVELVSADSWLHTRRNGDKLRIAKYSFIIEVHEALHDSPGGAPRPVPREEIPVRLEATEHQAFDWATESDVRDSLQAGKGKYQLPLPTTGHQAPNILRAFELWKEYQSRKGAWSV